MRFPPLPQAANRSFLEVAISFDTGTPPYACAAFFEPQWRMPLQAFSIRYGARFSMLPRQPTPAATLRSLKVDYWDASVAAFSASCSQLVELILWEPASLGDLTLPFADTLPPTLEHFAFPDDLIEVNSGSRAQRGAEFTALSQLPSRLERLRCVSMYNGSQSSWAVMLGVNCASVGIASSFGLKRTIIPRGFDVRDFAQLQAEDGGLNSDPIDELVCLVQMFPPSDGKTKGNHTVAHDSNTSWNHEILSTIESQHFFPCPGYPKLDCTNLVVPKDYFDDSAGTSTIAIARYNATVPNSKGTIFINPGGPGGSGVFFANLVAEVGQYSIIGFDPRGIARSRPVVDCFDTKFDYQAFTMGTVIERSFDLPPDPSSPEGYDSLVRQWASWRSLSAAQYHLCGEKHGDELKYMGTSTNVRDIDYMAKIFDGQDAPIHFWGGSYGSIMGAYLVNMLPNRVGRVFIEGIVNPVLWSNGASHDWLKDWMVDTDKTYQWLLDDCAEAGPSMCALAHENDTASAISERIDKYLDALYYSPVPITNHSRPGVLTSGQARKTLYFAVMVPMVWPRIAKYLRLAIDGDATPLYSLHTNELVLPPGPSPDAVPLSDLSRVAVSCADSPVTKADGPWNQTVL
ncbi:hypothetical protein EXIGLDRAFT_744177 [Exidia glandulosa HHB12029]|uniref:AB hydrolase-1 domain-containing protein n=1 Tax=Exidia glandulosa HHB12029 TaxID=1314781 RepID=A0A165QBZ7_EXIGL|nr:hypothetical protein EXIGLDRAFT_744177 [Exidia glandulosa HHB12029]